MAQEGVAAGGRGKATVKVFNLGLDTARGPTKIRLRFSTDDTSGPGAQMSPSRPVGCWNVRVPVPSPSSFRKSSTV